ncbi:DUF4079 domain-containing protein [Roseofilum sp. BLCC_M154]|uniref:DUF4079 domain-containing protein n=1 Tax=Roseofilum acuticapitatum BLCC-M154 TaxID=3022444 RepID=A0ABT7B150_9CYAN|nr:DUF4079 domain-containing protein [Roseofilum acuticapitatum]MDJ1172266.1 DUF4079 domain-containing protein [Roseofilum acuticapitatum BLCC-M154]
MDLPSFLWLWKIAAWSMGLALFSYGLLAMSGTRIWWSRQNRQPLPGWWRSLHYILGSILVFLVLLLLAIGIVGTLGHYGSLGHSSHLFAGLLVVALVLISATSATQISPQRPWARPLHLITNTILFMGFSWVSITGWSVVQKYLP